MAKLSVIIPIYNAEEYLHECIDSTLRQTMSDIEIILIDDGATDSSPQICDAYAKRIREFVLFISRTAAFVMRETQE